MGWVGNEGVDINWYVSPVSSSVIVLSHRGEFNNVKDSSVKGVRIIVFLVTQGKFLPFLM